MPPPTPSSLTPGDIAQQEHDDGSGSKRVSNQPINAGACLGASLTGIGTTGTAIKEVKAGSAVLAGRRGVYIKSTSTVVLYWGFASDACVFPLSKETAAGDGTGGEIWIDVGDVQAIYVKAASGSTNTAAIAELK